MQLKEIFSKYGNIRSLMLKKPKLNSQLGDSSVVLTTAYSIAYVDFEKEEDAAKAIEGLNGSQIEGSAITVEFYEKTQNAALRDTKDVVGNENLRALFIKDINKNVSFKDCL